MLHLNRDIPRVWQVNIAPVQKTRRLIYAGQVIALFRCRPCCPQHDSRFLTQHGIDDEVQLLRRFASRPPCRSPPPSGMLYPPTSASRIIPDARRRAWVALNHVPAAVNAQAHHVDIVGTVTEVRARFIGQIIVGIPLSLTSSIWSMATVYRW